MFRTDLNGEIDIEVNKKGKSNIQKFIKTNYQYQK